MHSRSQPKWCAAGTSLMPVGMGIPSECRNLVESYKKLYGEPPADLKISYKRGDDGSSEN